MATGFRTESTAPLGEAPQGRRGLAAGLAAAGVPVDAKGCPSDADGDGVYDGLDKCADAPKGATVDAKGCRELFTEERSTLVLEGGQLRVQQREADRKGPGDP